MRYCILIILSLLPYVNTMAQKRQTADSLNVAGWLNEARKQSSSTCLPVFFAEKFLGRPYVAHTLEVNDREQLVVNTRQLDCTTLVENVVALTCAIKRGKGTYKDYLYYLYIIRYRKGRNAGYVSRLHYFSEWIDDNTEKGIVEERQWPNPPFSAVQTVRLGYMSSHPASYKALRNNPALVDEIYKTEQNYLNRKYRYIPKSAVKNTAAMRKAVNNGDIIAITCKKKGLDIAHLGIAVWKKDGLHLLNASQIHKKVVLEPMTLGKYLSKHSSHTGIRIIKII